MWFISSAIVNAGTTARLACRGSERNLAFHSDMWVTTLNRKAMVTLIRDNGKYILLILKNYFLPAMSVRIKKENWPMKSCSEGEFPHHNPAKFHGCPWEFFLSKAY